jgi:GNAT superfamily N-acetyltransferase
MYVVSAVTPMDVDHLAVLMQEMDEFYGEPTREPLDVKVANVRAILFGDVPCAHALAAWSDSTLVGFASYSFLWPAVGSTKSLYLKELYVSQKVRRSGIGHGLMDGLLDVARSSQCTRVEWTTDADNSEARMFYERLGVAVQTSKLFYRTVIQ